MDEGSEQHNGAVERVRRGDVAALAEAFESHDRRLRATIVFRLDPRLNGRVDAGDILQEAYLNAFKRCAHVEGDTAKALFMWLRLIVIQTIADVHRRHLGAAMRDAGREQPIGGGWPGDHTSLSMAARLTGHLTSPTGALRRVELSEQLQSALGQMNDLDREVLALRHFEELTNQEVSDVLGIEEKAASIRYIRALRRLKEVLARISGLDPSSITG